MTLIELCLVFPCSGKITYYTHPPEKQTTHVSASIVTEMSKEFNIDDILQEEKSILEGREVGPYFMCNVSKLL